MQILTISSDFLIYPEATTGRLSRTSTIGESLCQEKPLRRIPVKVQRLASVLENYFPLESMFGLLSVDVEGAELGVLRSNDWERYRPRVLAIEDLQGPKHSDIDAFCVERGYSFFAYAIATKIFVSW